MNRFGDGLITLLMFAMGLGRLTLVFNGLVDGVVGGGKGATFPFAAKPIKFILIELIWASLGLVLLLGAWRGVTREPIDIDDEQDHDDDQVPTRPMSRTVEPIAAPKPLKPLQPVRTANVNALDLTRTGPLPRGVEPQTLELYNSKIYAVFVALVFTLFIVSSAYTSVAYPTVFFHHPTLQLVVLF